MKFLHLSTYMHLLSKKWEIFKFQVTGNLRYSLQTSAIIDVKVAHFGHKNLHKSALWSLISKISSLHELLWFDSTFEVISSPIGWNLFQCISHGMDKSGNTDIPWGWKCVPKLEFNLESNILKCFWNWLRNTDFMGQRLFK